MTTHIKNWGKGVLQAAAFFGAHFIFVTAGSLASLLCLAPAAVFHGVRVRNFGQWLIRALFRFFMGYVRLFGLVELEAGELSGLCHSQGLIVAANHPCLLDAVLVVSQLPRAVCLMKKSLARNLIFSGTARLAGYINNKSSRGLVNQCAERLQEGANLLVFPEGTRTAGGKLLPFKMGFALVAVLTGTPVQTIIITSESTYLGKGRPLLKIPRFPLRYSVRLGRRFVPEPGDDAKKFGAGVEKYFQEKISSSAKINFKAIQNR